MTNTSSSPVTDAMVERAWAAIVGTDVAGMCFQASIIRADLRTALEAVISPAQPSTSPGTSYTLRGEIGDAIREYCHSVSPAAVQMSHGVERIYYSGISLDGLTDAIFAALGAGFAETATREALEEINALISNGDRPTVNERNAFEHFTALNRLLLNIRDIARRALSSVPSTLHSGMDQVKRGLEKYQHIGPSVPSTDKAPIGGTESCTCHFLGAGMHHIPGCPYYAVVTSKDQP